MKTQYIASSEEHLVIENEFSGQVSMPGNWDSFAFHPYRDLQLLVQGQFSEFSTEKETSEQLDTFCPLLSIGIGDKQTSCQMHSS